jgi:glycerol-3-phosphate acyltransferase PlsY
MMSFSLTPSVAMSGKELTWIVTSYFLGCFTAGYYWTRWRTGKDIRALGSGLITFLMDFSKGVLAVAGATYFKLGPEAMIATMFAVAAGHNWPVQLHFKGGKGIAVSLGALLAYDPFIVLCLAVIFVPVFAMIRLFTLSGMLAFTLAPLGGFLCGLEKEGVAAVSILAVLALITHRRNIRKELARLVFHRSVEDAEMHKGPNDEV